MSIHAGWVVEFAVVLNANLAAIGLTPLVNYVTPALGQAVDHGLHAGPVEDVPLRVTVAHFHRVADGALGLQGLKIEGPAAAAADLNNPDVASQFETAKNETDIRAVFEQFGGLY